MRELEHVYDFTRGIAERNALVSANSYQGEKQMISGSDHRVMVTKANDVGEGKVSGGGTERQRATADDVKEEARKEHGMK